MARALFQERQQVCPFCNNDPEKTETLIWRERATVQQTYLNLGYCLFCKCADCENEWIERG